MKRSTEQVLKDEIAVATRAVDKAVTRVEKSNQEWNIAANHAQVAAGVLADASARLLRAEAALDAFTPRPTIWAEAEEEELTPVPTVEVPIVGEVS